MEKEWNFLFSSIGSFLKCLQIAKAWSGWKPTRSPGRWPGPKHWSHPPLTLMMCLSRKLRLQAQPGLQPRFFNYYGLSETCSPQSSHSCSHSDVLVSVVDGCKSGDLIYRWAWWEGFGWLGAVALESGSYWCIFLWVPVLPCTSLSLSLPGSSLDHSSVPTTSRTQSDVQLQNHLILKCNCQTVSWASFSFWELLSVNPVKVAKSRPIDVLT